MRNYPGKIGILTFHCADNFGAMLQAYGLLTWLSGEGFGAFIVNYVPPFLRGREWLFPYAPAKSLKKRIDTFLWGLKRNITAGRERWIRKRLMAEFRTAYLTGGSRPIHRTGALSRLEADLLIVGSDQIWNPDITFGLRPAYFGAFQNRQIRKTIAYAASFGTAALPEEEEPEFSRLLGSVHDISMREKAAAEYVEARFERRAVHVVDPVFLLRAEDWYAIADRPKESGFILYYETECCEPLREAAASLAQKKGLKVIGLSVEGNGWGNWPFQKVWAVGPAQFLGYIAEAGYIFTNSFHGLAFSILLHKPFYVYDHRTVGARIESLLESVGLTGRMATRNRAPDIDEEINWVEVERMVQTYRERSLDFLRHSLGV